MGKFEVVKDEFRVHPNTDIKLPIRGSLKAGAYDFYSPEVTIVPPHTSVMIWTDVKAKFDDSEMLLLNVRSSMGKDKIMLANTQGWIDADYYDNESNDGNIGIMLYNFSREPYFIKKYDRIAQAMLVKHGLMDGAETGGERIGGFGSTNEQ